MKKLLSVVLAVFIVMSSSIITVYAENGHSGLYRLTDSEGMLTATASGVSQKITDENKDEIDGENNDEDKEDSIDKQSEKNNEVEALKQQLEELKVKMEKLKEALKEQKEDKEKKKEIIREIVKIKRQENDHSTPIFVNGEEVETDVPPVIKDGRTLVPVRAVTNALGAKVEWNADIHLVTVTKAVYDAASGTEQTITINITMGSNVALVNGKQVTIDAPAQLTSNRTMVPLRFISETFKQSVEWDSASGSVIIENTGSAGTTTTTTPTTTDTTATQTTTTTQTSTTTPTP